MNLNSGRKQECSNFFFFFLEGGMRATVLNCHLSALFDFENTLMLM